MNSLYPECDSIARAPQPMPPLSPDPNQTKAEIDYLVELFRVQTECLKRTGHPLADAVPAGHQPDLPGT